MIRIVKIWLTEDAVWVRREDGEEAYESFADYPRLRDASSEQRARYVTDAFGLSWPDLDEDLSFEGFFQSREKSDLYRIFINHPELNASAVARRLGISQSLFAQYIGGQKKPSKDRLDQIKSLLHTIGKELMGV